VFSALVVTVKTYVLRVTTKKVNFSEFARPSLEKILRAPMTAADGTAP